MVSYPSGRRRRRRRLYIRTPRRRSTLLLIRPLADHAHAVANPAILVLRVSRGRMEQTAVVPDHQVFRPPFVRIDVVGAGRLRIEILEERRELLLTHVEGFRGARR